MSGNSFGHVFRLTTYGESHGPALGGIVDGCPPGIPLNEDDIQQALDRRKPGQSKWTSQRREEDRINILSGVFEGQTTGTPIGLLIHNKDARSKDYDAIAAKFRPGHADWTYWQKYGRRDHRGGGRASARETVIRVAAGAIAQKCLARNASIEINAHVIQIGSLRAKDYQPKTIRQNPFFCADPAMALEAEQLLNQVRKEGDSVGGCVQVIAKGVPAGWGNPVFDKLDADLAKAMMSINAAKAVALGAGFNAAAGRGSVLRDEMDRRGFLSNHAGGVLGGISSGQDIVVDVAFKPTSSILKPARTIDIHGNPTSIEVKGRHDPCVAIRAVPIVEAMCCLVLLDHQMLHQAQMGNKSDQSVSLTPPRSY